MSFSTEEGMKRHPKNLSSEIVQSDVYSGFSERVSITNSGFQRVIDGVVDCIVI